MALSNTPQHSLSYAVQEVGLGASEVCAILHIGSFLLLIVVDLHIHKDFIPFSVLSGAQHFQELPHLVQRVNHDHVALSVQGYPPVILLVVGTHCGVVHIICTSRTRLPHPSLHFQLFPVLLLWLYIQWACLHS